MPSKKPTYDPALTYRFTLKQTVKHAGCRYGRADLHEAAGSLLNALTAQEGPDVIDTADAI